MDIWNDWQEHYRALGIDHGRICKDGILCADAYKMANTKVLFVMKEVNRWPGGNLPDSLSDGPHGQMWYTISRWAAGLFKGFPQFEKIDDYATMKESLRKVAAVNLKKPSGDASANMSVVSAYAHQDKPLLLEQFRNISPNVVVACGTFDILVWLLELKVDADNPSGRPVYDATREAWVIPFRHPARPRENNREMYGQLESVVKQEPALWNWVTTVGG
jgi:hypothetical protein